MAKDNPKSIPFEQFQRWTSAYGWNPAQVSPSDYPYFTRNMDPSKIAGMWASGTVHQPRLATGASYHYEDAIGGMDLMRIDPKDSALGFPYNKDHYVFVHDKANVDVVQVFGPYGKGEPDHWLHDLPDHLKKAPPSSTE